MAVKFTPEQRSAIEKRNADILVSAAAGSGKTAVLAERILSMLTEGSADIDELLCLTFTDAAASEMREKIYNKITEYTEAHPDDERMASQLKRLRKADISTIDSFIGSVVKSHCHIVDIDPNYRIITGGEILRIQLEVLEDMFAQKYAERDCEFFDLIEKFCPHTDDRPLKDLILEVYGYAVSMPRPKKWLNECTKRFDIDKDTDFSSVVWGRYITQYVKTNAAQAEELAERMIEICVGNTVPAYEELLAASREISRLADSDICGLRSYLHNTDISKPRKTSLKFAAEDVDILAAMFENAKGILDGLADYIDSMPLDRWQENIIALKPTLNALVSLVLEFTDEYTARKKDERLAEFDDISHYALDILTDEDGCPTAAAYGYRRQYKEIIIDEYQDCSFIQDAILEAVSRRSDGTPNRFMVGDIKQCIYKFRKANPEIFAQKYRDFGGSDPSGSLILLSKNFRSRKNILDTCNFLFYQLMTPDFGGIDYNEAAALNCGARYSQCDKHTDAVEVCLINTTSINKDPLYSSIPANDKVSAVCEAVYTANRIKELLDGGFVVEDPHSGAKRAAQLGDIVILFRSRKPIPVFTAILAHYGIPVMTQQSISLFDALEVSMLVSFLKAIDNPLQDIHLLTMLFSPVYGIDANELVRLGSPENKYLYESVCDYAAGHEDGLAAKLCRFLDDIKYFSALAQKLVPMSELLESIYNKTGLYNYVSLLSGGDVRRQNLDTLLLTAYDYDANGSGSLYGFIQHLDSLAAAGTKTDAAPAAQTNCVYAMTMHQSKGLEFPIVFLPQMCARFKHNTGGQRPDPTEVASNKNIALSQELGIGMRLIDPEKRTVANTLTNMCIASHAELDELHENLRVLYVAMTRAKQKLFMVGAATGSKALTRALSYVTYGKRALPQGFMQNSAYFMDWILTCLARSGAMQELHSRPYSIDFCRSINDFEFDCEFYYYDKDNFFSLVGTAETPDTAAEDMAALFDKLNSGKNDCGDMEKLLGWQYPHERTAALPSKTSISEIKRRWQEDEHAEEPDILPELKPPVFAESGAVLTGAARGTAYHSFMEHTDFSYKNADDVENAKKRMVTDGILTEEEANAVRPEKILAFLQSDLCARIKRSPDVRRETAFTLGLTPYELYRDEIYKDDREIINVDGIIDLFFEEDGDIVLVDYKTDRLDGGIAAVVSRYSIQLELYAMAIERALGKKVKQKLLYLFAADTAVEL